MPPIEIPESYWDISPRGFSALTASAQPAVQALYDQLGADQGDLQLADDGDVGPALATLDGDAWAIDSDVSDQVTSLTNTPIGAVIGQYPSADALHFQGDTDVAPVAAVPGA